MPIYEYRCRNGHQFEVFRAMSDDPLTECQECGAPVERVFRPVAVHFKGSGFYTTDYARKTMAKTSEDGGSDSKKKSSDSKDKASETKKPATASSKDDSS